jgi:hypothetical protein
MKSIMVAFFFIAIIGLYGFLGSSRESQRRMAVAEVAATDFLIYRDTAFTVALERGTAGVIQPAELAPALPAEYRITRPWNARVEGTFLYVWGPAAPGEIEAVRAAVRGSAAVGVARGGIIEPQRYEPVPLPAFVAQGSLVSVLGLGFEAVDPD